MSAAEAISRSAVVMHRCCTSCGAHYASDLARCPNDGAEVLEHATDPLIGSAAIAPYVIEALIGEGSMGRVYRARHARLDLRRHAIKVLRGDLAMTQSSRLRFAQEAELASSLAHPNVVTVSDFGRTAKGLLYIAMELVDGTSLADAVAAGPIAPERAIRIARGIAAGLAHAHDHRVIHRDLKPDNVLLVGTGAAEVARIADFGIAVHADPLAPRLTATGFTLGTPAYIAPEAVVDGRFDHRADLYALGVTLYEMLAGVLPYEGYSVEQMVAKTIHEPPAIAVRAPGVVVPPALEQLVRTLMARKPGARHATAAAVIAELDRIADATVPATFAGTAAVPRPRPRRRGRIVAALCAAAAIAGVALGLWSRRGEHHPAAMPAQAAHAAAAVAAQPDTAPTVVVIAPEPVAAAAVVVAPEPVAALDPERERDHRPGRRHHRSHKHDRAARLAAPPHPEPAPAPAPSLARAPVAAPPAPAPTPAPAALAATPAPGTPRSVMLDARLGRVAVDGALAASVARRAVARTLPALRRCARGAEPGAVEVTFSVGESRRAANVRASGASPGVADCVADVIAGVRSESAPDIGDATVTVQVAFSRPAP